MFSCSDDSFQLWSTLSWAEPGKNAARHRSLGNHWPSAQIIRATFGFSCPVTLCLTCQSFELWVFPFGKVCRHADLWTGIAPPSQWVGEVGTSGLAVVVLELEVTTFGRDGGVWGRGAAMLTSWLDLIENQTTLFNSNHEASGPQKWSQLP